MHRRDDVHQEDMKGDEEDTHNNEEDTDENDRRASDLLPKCCFLHSKGWKVTWHLSFSSQVVYLVVHDFDLLDAFSEMTFAGSFLSHV